MPPNNTPLRLLVVEDNEADYDNLVRLIRTGMEPGTQVDYADTGAKGLAAFEAHSPDCILLDYRLPDMDGLEFLTELAAVGGGMPVPVVMLTGMGNEAIAVEALKNGAQNYLNKNTMTGSQVVHAVNGAIEMVELRREVETAKRVLEQMAFYDALTGIGNRNLFTDRLNHGLTLASRSSNTLAVMVIDLVEFKAVNDTYGHAAGDVMLRTVGERLLTVLRQADTAARLGGDEFAIILETNVTLRGTMFVAQKIIDELAKPVDFEGYQIEVGASIGIALYPEHAEDADQLVRCADLAMYQTKAGGSGPAVYSPELALQEEIDTPGLPGRCSIQQT